MMCVAMSVYTWGQLSVSFGSPLFSFNVPVLTLPILSLSAFIDISYDNCNFCYWISLTYIYPHALIHTLPLPPHPLSLTHTHKHTHTHTHTKPTHTSPLTHSHTRTHALTLHTHALTHTHSHTHTPHTRMYPRLSRSPQNAGPPNHPTDRDDRAS